MGVKVKFIISDCHLSAGRFFEGKLNLHEDFHFDHEMVDLFTYFSTGEYGYGDQGPVEVELVINGDYLDFLNVAVESEFPDAVTEEMALKKLDAIFAGHVPVMNALRQFASRPGKKITYLVGNHDADLFFPQVREKITRHWDPQGRYPSPVVEVVTDRQYLAYPEYGIEIHHGNQFEVGSEVDFEEPMKTRPGKAAILKLPWSSLYVLKIVNLLKQERSHLDKVRPVKVFLILGLLFDPLFTIKFYFLSIFYFFKTRIFTSFKSFKEVKKLMELLREESRFFLDLEEAARELLDEKEEVKTVIFGHTHRPMHKLYPDGKQYLNTGTWTKMLDLDWRYFGEPVRRTFCLIHIREGEAPQCELRQWIGESAPHRIYSV